MAETVLAKALSRGVAAAASSGALATPADLDAAFTPRNEAACISLIDEAYASETRSAGGMRAVERQRVQG